MADSFQSTPQERMEQIHQAFDEWLKKADPHNLFVTSHGFAREAWQDALLSERVHIDAATTASSGDATKVMDRILQANEGKIEAQARNVNTAAVIGVGIGPALRSEAFSGDKQQTPRTDAAAFKQGGRYVDGNGVAMDPVIELVHAHFARQLERELAAQEVQMNAVRYRAEKAEQALSATLPMTDAVVEAQYWAYHAADYGNPDKYKHGMALMAREILRLNGTPYVKVSDGKG